MLLSSEGSLSICCDVRDLLCVICKTEGPVLYYMVCGRLGVMWKVKIMMSVCECAGVKGRANKVLTLFGGCVHQRPFWWGR